MEKTRKPRARWKTTFPFTSRAEYQRQYAQLPDIKEKNRLKWSTPEYRLKKKLYYQRTKTKI